MEGTETISPLPHNNKPKNRRIDVTYGRIVVDYFPPKDDMYITCLTVGRNLIKYQWEAIKGTSYLTMEKLLFSSTISATGVCFMCYGINNVYLATPVEWYKYIRLKLNIIPEEIIEN